MRNQGTRSKIAQLDYTNDVDPKYVPGVILTRDDFFARINHEPIKQTLTIANIPIGSAKKQKTEKEQLQDIIDKKPSTKKVRKFFYKYYDRLNEEDDAEPGFLTALV